MESCVRRACNRVGLEKWEWPLALGVACALYKGFYARPPKKEERRTYTMSLDKERHTRDYLYGRLLAAAEYIERSALDLAGEKRPTNAERIMQRFADHPYSTWLTLYKSLNPYMQRLQSAQKFGLPTKCKKLLQEISDAFLTEDFISNERLSGEFLLGYHCQLSDLYTAKPKDETSPANPEGE
jgi:CRISPR-associated protein Csd1